MRHDCNVQLKKVLEYLCIAFKYDLWRLLSHAIGSQSSKRLVSLLTGYVYLHHSRVAMLTYVCKQMKPVVI